MANVTFDPKILEILGSDIPEAQKNLIRLILAGKSFVNPLKDSLSASTKALSDAKKQVLVDVNSPYTLLVTTVPPALPPPPVPYVYPRRVFSGTLPTSAVTVADIVDPENPNSLFAVMDSFSSSFGSFAAHTNRLSGAVISNGKSPNIAQLLSIAVAYNSAEETIRNSDQEKKDNFSIFFGSLLSAGPLVQEISIFCATIRSSLFQSTNPAATLAEIIKKLKSYRSRLNSLASNDAGNYKKALDHLSKYAVGASAAALVVSDSWVNKLFKEVTVSPGSEFSKNIIALEEEEEADEYFLKGREDEIEEEDKTVEEIATKIVNDFVGPSGVEGNVTGTENVQVLKNKSFQDSSIIGSTATGNKVDANFILGRGFAPDTVVSWNLNTAIMRSAGGWSFAPLPYSHRTETISSGAIATAIGPNDPSINFITLAQATTLLKNPSPATIPYAREMTWFIIQDGTGSRLLTFDTNFRFSTTLPLVDIVLSTAAGQMDMIKAIYYPTSTKWLVTEFIKGFSTA